MKKISVITVFILLVNLLCAQSFHKGALVTEFNTGFEIYNTVLKVRIKDPNHLRDTSYNDKAGNRNFGFGLEYGLHKNFGVGFRFKANNYFTTRDSVTGAKPEVKTNDFALTLNYHPVSKKHFDLIIGTDIGYSTFKYKAKDSLGLILSGGGSFIAPYINPRIYFGRFGINFKLYAPFTNYNKLTTNNEDFNKYIAITKWKGSGFGMSFGIQYRFMEDKASVKPSIN